MERDVDGVLSSGEKVEHLSTDQLRPILRFRTDQQVLHRDGWFGQIDEVKSVLLFAVLHLQSHALLVSRIRRERTVRGMRHKTERA